MSYYVRFNFIENVEVNDVLPTISKFKKFFNDNAEQIVKKRFDKRPSVYDEWVTSILVNSSRTQSLKI